MMDVEKSRKSLNCFEMVADRHQVWRVKEEVLELEVMSQDLRRTFRGHLSREILSRALVWL